MNKLRNTALILVALLTIFSCEKDDAEPSEIKFKLDGEEQILTGVTNRVKIYSNNEFLGEYSLDIEDNSNGTIHIALDIWHFEEVEKTYYVQPQANRSFNPRVKIDDIWYRGEDTGIGSIEITEITGNRITGTFTFEAKSEASDIVSITEGTFDLPYDPNDE